MHKIIFNLNNIIDLRYSSLIKSQLFNFHNFVFIVDSLVWAGKKKNRSFKTFVTLTFL